ncbi:hypothetical protein [endosymbiont GvMRE of Glomus versiforme]|uniref:hypothetical protein n=1 Tax=endosymbiont GvMRE of Glomus versiforme TaxID=2039283 RepID=UPI000EDBAC26|nr:hypothetical protein [endosymbiont GvMRE of Glomus versiforme]RHZ37136.1 hypothetical protein GvMRE_I1g59 [endosymbiont GvMRE of Glomus versiforme]
MNKKICFDCNRQIPEGREIKIRENRGSGLGVFGGRWGWGGWGGGGGWGSGGSDTASLWLCYPCYRWRKTKRLIITLLIVGFFVAIFLGFFIWTWVKIGKHF